MKPLPKSILKTVTRPSLIIIGAALAISATSAFANGMYRWVGSDGKFHFGDAPPANAKQILTINPGVPLDLQQQSQANSNSGNIVKPTDTLLPTVIPSDVTILLYITNCGDACNNARSFMVQKSLTYREVDPLADETARANFIKLSPDSVVPTLVIQKANGEQQVLSGFNNKQWTDSMNKYGINLAMDVKEVKPEVKPESPKPAFNPSLTGYK